MPLEAFNSSASIIDVLNGGVNSVGRSLLLAQQGIQTNAVGSIEESFASRIDEAIARLNQTDTSPKISALRREQSILASRKERLNQAIEVLNKTLTQTKLIKSALNYLQDILGGLTNSIVGGEPIKSLTISLRTVESEIANSLTKVQNDNQDVEIGSYPFFHAGKLGVSIVIRSEDQNKIDNCNSQILKFVNEKKIEVVDR